MQWSRSFIPTLKEIPSEAESISHRLMLRAGLIRKLGAGLYTYLPLGLRVIRNIETIIREEMNGEGAIELLMPILQPREVWEASGRWDVQELSMLTLSNRQEKEFALSPTHEEIITSLVAQEISSYRQLPRNFYQIQVKFRDELRPRYGVVRAKEFIMKDGYSFDVDEESAGKSYQAMYDAYTRIFHRCGLTALPVEADTGAMGGSLSHEFMVPAEIGEDIIVTCSSCKYAANRERSEVKPAQYDNPAGNKVQVKLKPLEEVDTPGIKTIEALKEFLFAQPEQMIKTIVYDTEAGAVAALMRGDRGINETKLKNALGCQQLSLASAERIAEVTGAPLGFSGPVGLSGVKVVADCSVMNVVNAITGANAADKHLLNVNVERDWKPQLVADISLAQEGDGCPRCDGILSFRRGIEVGQVFSLGTKYSKTLRAVFLDQEGKEKPAVMGCYGIGVSRTVAAIIEEHHDANGIIWPLSVSPYQVHIVSLGTPGSVPLELARQVEKSLQQEGVEVLWDNRNERAGVKFKDADLLGIPIRITAGPKQSAKGKVELKLRDSDKVEIVAKEQIASKVKKIIAEQMAVLQP